MTIELRIKERALDLGFDFIGIAPAREAARAGVFRRWLKDGYHADMAWLEKDPARRADPRRVVENARSVLSVGLSYFTELPPASLWDDPARGRIARYAWGPDYHDELEPRLRALLEFIRAEADGPVNGRYYTDTGPVLEHETAWQAGVGFLGRNTLLIHPAFGSYVFLGEILLDLELEPDAPARDEGARLRFTTPEGQRKTASCGNCRRCLTVCPTHAFPAPYILDSRRCISWLTIENKGSIPEDLRPKMKNWIYGCDECQEICPWVRRYSQPGRTRFLEATPERYAPRLTELMAMDDDAFRARFKGSPIARIRRRRLLRNVAVALGNAGDPATAGVLEKAMQDPEPLIREHAAWARERV